MHAAQRLTALRRRKITLMKPTEQSNRACRFNPIPEEIQACT